MSDTSNVPSWGRGAGGGHDLPWIRSDSVTSSPAPAAATVEPRLSQRFAALVARCTLAGHIETSRRLLVRLVTPRSIVALYATRAHTRTPRARTHAEIQITSVCR